MKDNRVKLLVLATWSVVLFSLVTPVIPMTVTGWDEADSWQYGVIVELLVLFRLLAFFPEISTAREESKGSYGDGFECWLRDHIRLGILDLVLFVGCCLALATILLLWSPKCRAFCATVWCRAAFGGVLLISAIRAVQIVESGSRTYVWGALHLGIGAIPWCVSFVLVALVYVLIPCPANASESSDRRTRRVLFAILLMFLAGYGGFRYLWRESVVYSSLSPDGKWRCVVRDIAPSPFRAVLFYDIQEANRPINLPGSSIVSYDYEDRALPQKMDFEWSPGRVIVRGGRKTFVGEFKPGQQHWQEETRSHGAIPAN